MKLPSLLPDCVSTKDQTQESENNEIQPVWYVLVHAETRDESHANFR